MGSVLTPGVTYRDDTGRDFLCLRFLALEPGFRALLRDASAEPHEYYLLKAGADEVVESVGPFTVHSGGSK